MKVDSYIDRESPFQPGKRVSYSNFRGREDSILKILRYVKSATNEEVQHFFLTGKKGIGKTSLSQYVKNYVESNIGMTGVYVSNKDNSALEGLINLIIESLLSKVPKNKIEDKVKSLFGSIEGLEFKGAKVKFKPNINTANDLRLNFHFYINKLINDINSDKGVFLVIDDINGLSESQDFVNWYKRFADTIEMDESINLKLYILIVGYPEKFNSLVLKEQSFGRIFHYEEIGLLEDFEIKEFFIDTFNSVNINCNQVIDDFVYFSSGLPLMMQQIGDSAFWMEKDGVLTKNILFKCINNAANEIGSKQIRPALDLISDDIFDSILLKLAQNEIKKFEKSELEHILNVSESNKLDDFLKTMLKLGILNSKGINNIYEFSNDLYFAYFKIKSSLI